MKLFFAAFIFFTTFCVGQNKPKQNIFIISTDGFRWQELFNGADSVLINNTRFVKDTGVLKQLYWNDNSDERRKLLMPFIWNTLVKKGTLYGNRKYNSKVSVANAFKISYAGYNEIFTGFVDNTIITNSKKYNKNQNLLQFLNEQPDYKNSVAAFASWNLFEYIFNKNHSSIYLNSGYQTITHDSLTDNEILANGVQQYAVNNTVATRNDMLTFVTAKEYIKTQHPKVVYIGFGETDEYAHSGNYDEYLQSAHLFDEYIAQLWYLVNKDSFYKNNTSFIITTDHGRGKNAKSWVRHGLFTLGSSETWLMTLGNAFEPQGEIKNNKEIFNKQFAQTIAQLLGYNFTASHPVAQPLQTVVVNNKK
jgi:Metalloenzyme superfamily